MLARAHDLADRRGDAALTPAHVALGLLTEGQNVAAYVLSARGVPLDALMQELAAALPAAGTPRASAAGEGWTPDDDALATRAAREAREMDMPYYGAEHLLLALLCDDASAPAELLARHGVTYANARAGVQWVHDGRRDVAPPWQAAG